MADAGCEMNDMFQLLASDQPSLGAWVLAITTVIGSVSAAVVSVVVAFRTKDVQQSVRTGNGKTIGQAVSETYHAVTTPSSVPPIGEAVAEVRDAVLDPTTNTPQGGD